MLSIAAIKSSASAVSYFEKDDYYTKAGASDRVRELEVDLDAATRPTGPVPGGIALEYDRSGDSDGVWFGRGADRLGLKGMVDRRAFQDLLDGRLPNGAVLGSKRGKAIEHRPGWELTFSAPKSVSIVAEVGGDERVIRAHHESVKEALEYLQDDAAMYRQRGLIGPRERRGDNLTFALFQHDTNRNQDPNLHTHAVVANVIQRADGQWASLAEKPIYEHKMAAGTVYRAALAMRLQALGYEVERTHRDGRFEIAGVPESVAEAFASRRQEIEEALREQGLEGAEAAERAALRTRAPKRDIAPAELRHSWLDRSRELGFDAEHFVGVAREAGPQSDREPPNLDRPVRDAIGRLSETEAVFTDADLVRWSLAGAIGRGSLADIRLAISRAARTHELHDAKLGHRKSWTTPVARAQEARVVGTLQRGRGSVTPTVGRNGLAAAVREFEERGFQLGERQLDAIKLITSTRDRIVGVIGRPGTGKTFVLDFARQALESAGHQVRGMAPNSEVARQLESEAHIPSATIEKHLVAIGEDLAKWRRGGPVERREIESRYESQVWIVDEASQVDSARMRRILYGAETLGTRLVLVGDPQQLAAIDAGKPFDLLLQHGMQHVEMDEIHRQRNAHQRAAVLDVVKGDVTKAMERLADRTTPVRDKEKRLERIVATWDAGRKQGREPIVLTARNVDRTFLSDRMRDVRRGAGELKGEVAQRQLFRVFQARADRVFADAYRPGDVVRFGRDTKKVAVRRGDYFVVTTSDPKTNKVGLEKIEGRIGDAGRPESPDRIEWDPQEIAGGAKFGVEQYRPRESTIAPGERIVWNRNSTELGLTNGYVLTVVGTEAGRMTLRKDDGNTVTVDTGLASQSHWEHDYAKTVYKAQGKTADHVLVNAEASAQQLFNQKAFLVAISRQRDDIRLFTDDTEQFTNNVRYNLGDKTSAIESQRAPADPRDAFLANLSQRWMDADQMKRSEELTKAARQKQQERQGPSLEMF